MKRSKYFYYNVLVKKEDLADRLDDIKNICTPLLNRRKITLFAPRRYGKSSLCKNIIPEEIKAIKKKILPIYIDFMGCESEDDFTNRMLEGVTGSLKIYKPIKFWMKVVEDILKTLTLSFKPDPFSGEMSMELTSRKGVPPKFTDFLKTIEELNNKFELLIIFDEFQDITPFKNIQGALRSFLQSLNKTPMLFLGSKKRLLIELFANNNSPFYQFADSYILMPIPLEEWVPYYSERLIVKNIEIKKEALKKIIEISMNVPNTICEIGAFIYDYYQDTIIDEKKLIEILNDLLDKKSELYKQQLVYLSETEKKICIYIAKQKFVKQITGAEFSRTVSVTPSGVKKAIFKLFKLGVLEEEDQGFRIANPLFGLYLEFKVRLLKM